MKSKHEVIKNKLRPIIKNILAEDAKFGPRPLWVLEGISVKDLVLAVQSAESEIDEKTVVNVFNELVQTSINKARRELKLSMTKIISLAKK